MKRIVLTLLAIVGFIYAHAQTVDEVVDKYLVALGGKEKLMALNTIKLNGSLSTQGFEIPITVTVLNAKGARTDISVPGMAEGYRIVTPEKGWVFAPYQGMTEPEEMPDDQWKVQSMQLDLQTPLLDYAKKGHKVELLGKEKIGDNECYKLKITYKNGASAVLFIDSKTYYRVKSVIALNVNGSTTDQETTYADFRKTPEGYVFPYSQTNQGGTITYSSIEINKPVDENIFRMN